MKLLNPEAVDASFIRRKERAIDELHQFEIAINEKRKELINLNAQANDLQEKMQLLEEAFNKRLENEWKQVHLLKESLEERERLLK